MKQPNVSLYVPLNKVDAEKREVSGYATTEAMDSQGEVVKLDAVERALGDYMKWANIREMHSSSAVGVTKNAILDEKGLYITAKIVDDQAWAKVTEGVYKGFSIGGRKLLQKGKEILDLMLTEISLVDRPANPEAVIDVWKRDIGKAESNGEKSQEEVRAMLYAALMEYVEEMNPMMEDMDCGYYILEVFSDHFIASDYRNGTSWSFPYTIIAEKVALGEPTEVKLVWEEKAEAPTMTKALGYTPHWLKQTLLSTATLNKKSTMSVDKDKIKKDDAAPVDQGQPVPEVPAEVPVEKPVEVPVEKPVETPAEKPVEETPVVPPAEKPADAPVETPVEKPADAPVETPTEKPADKAAGLTADEKTLMKSAIGLFAKLLGEAAPSTNENADVQSSIAKVAGDEVAKVVADALATESKANDVRFAAIEGQLTELTKTIQPVKAKAGFALTKGDETPAVTGEKGEKLATLQKRASELADLKKSIAPSEYQMKYASEAQQVFSDLRSLEAEIGVK